MKCGMPRGSKHQRLIYPGSAFGPTGGNDDMRQEAISLTYCAK